MSNGIRNLAQRPWYMLLATTLLLGVLVVAVAAVSAQEEPMPDWLEPRGISVVELVGQVPDEYLQGTILSYGDGDGIVIYEAGSRSGNTVVMTTTLYPRLSYPGWAQGRPVSSFGCLGQTPHFDHQGTMVPASTLRVFDAGGAEWTQSIHHMYLTHMDIRQPSGGSSEPFRYPEHLYGPGPDADFPLSFGANGLIIRANSGCRIELPGTDARELTGVFTMEFEADVQATIRSTQVFTFQSYIGVGGVGIFQPLMDQMRGTFGDRHARIPLEIPVGASFYLINFPPMPGDAYSDQNVAQPPYPNADRPTGGTYRLSRWLWELSTDTTFSAAFPLQVAWQDSDQASGSEFLPVMWEPDDLAPPEYVIPAGIPYNPCFTTGYCSNDVLQQVHDEVMSAEIVYLEVDRLTQNGQWVPVKMAGPAWAPASASGAGALSDSGTAALEQPANLPLAPLSTSSLTTTTHLIFLPYIAREIQEEPAPEGCPCGYFDEWGRMLDFYPGDPVFSAPEE